MEEKRFLKRKQKAFCDGNEESLAQSCNDLGDFYNQHGRYEEALKEYEQEAAIYDKLKRELEMAKAHRMAAEMCMLLCKFKFAEQHVNIYLKVVKRLENKVEEQRAYATLGRIYLLQVQSSDEFTNSSALENAERSFIRSLLLSKELSGQITKLEQLDMQARCYLNMGVVKEQLGEIEESIVFVNRSIKIAKANDIYELTHLCYITMSILYHNKRKDSTTALRYCNLALEVAERLPNRVKKICETLITKSEILIKENDFASAKQVLTKAYKKNTPDENDRKSIEKSLRVVVKMCQILDDLVTVSSTDFKQRKVLFEKLGDGCCCLQNFSKAIEYYQQMLECAELSSETGKALIPIYVSLYQTYKDDKQYDKALEYLWKEYDLNKDVPKEAFYTLLSICEICEIQMQPFWTIHDLYQKAVEQAFKCTDDINKKKLEKIAYTRLVALQRKFNMNTLADNSKVEAKSKGIDLDEHENYSDDDESDRYSNNDQNIPEIGDDVCLEDLIDSESSDIDESKKPRVRKRGTCLTIKRNNKGETQLHQACIAGNFELVRRLVEQGHTVNVRDHAGWIPLHEACNHGYTNIVEFLLDNGSATAINDKGGTSCDGITPLYDACSNGYLDVVELLLERGADPTLKTDFGDTCLNALDKWRKQTTELTDCEQAHYISIRDTLQKRLTKAGISCPLENRPSILESEEEIEYDVDESRESANHIPSSRRKERKDCLTAKSAKAEYKSVMENLKRPHRLENVGTDLGCSGTKKRSAFLQTDEVDESTWLDNDLAPDKKKRKCINLTVDQSPHTSSTVVYNEDETDLIVPWETEEPDAFQIMLEASSANREKNITKNKLTRSSSIHSTTSSTSAKSERTKRKEKHQLSLFDNGFSSFRNESPISNEDLPTDSNHYFSIEPDSTTAVHQQMVSPKQILPSTISFKIKVEEELLLVPIERNKLNEAKIQWLADEASRRYYNLVGLKPVLRLKTIDGFAFEENDTISVALEQSTISAVVLEWKISPLEQRYVEMCLQLKKEVNSDVQVVLEKAQVSNSVNFNDFSLTPDLTEPIFKALLHQKSLRILDLSNNFIQNEGCRQLSKSLCTLKQLKVLNLQGNCITSDGLEMLTSVKNFQLDSLEELVLSQNPLCNTSIKQLNQICIACKSLQTLFLDQCNITTFYDFDLNFFHLSDFNVSFNILDIESRKLLLSKLNLCRLKNLNLSFTQTLQQCTASSADQIADFFESGPSCEKLKRVDLAGCDLRDVHVYRLVQCLKNATDLEVLNISDNPRLSSMALQYIIDYIPQLQKIISINCTRLMNDFHRLGHHIAECQSKINFWSLSLHEELNEVNKSCEKQRIESFWTSRWGDRGKSKFNDGNIILYTNACDLNYF